MQAHEEAAAIIAYYVRAAIERSGLKWTAANDADFVRVADLLGQGTDAGGDTLPPYQAPIVSDRQTVNLDDVERRQWGDFQRWQTARAEDERVEQARRIMRR